MKSYTEKLAASVQELNTLAVKNIEELTALQLKTIQDNATVGIDTVRSATAISDLEGFQSFLTEQANAAKQIAEGIFANVRTVTELGQAYIEEVKEITETSLQAAK